MFVLQNQLILCQCIIKCLVHMISDIGLLCCIFQTVLFSHLSIHLSVPSLSLLNLLVKIIEVLIFCLLYLSILIDAITQHARVSAFSAIIIKSKRNQRYVTLPHIFYLRLYKIGRTISLSFITKILKLTDALALFVFYTNIYLICCGDIETNPRPKFSSLSFCHWNLNGLTAHNFLKIALLHTYITQHNYVIICLSETSFKLSIEIEFDILKIDSYNLLRSDNLSGLKSVFI